RAHDRARAGTQRGACRSGRARARPRPHAIRARGRARAREPDGGSRRVRPQPPEPAHRRLARRALCGVPRPEPLLRDSRGHPEARLSLGTPGAGAGADPAAVPGGPGGRSRRRDRLHQPRPRRRAALGADRPRGARRCPALARPAPRDARAQPGRERGGAARADDRRADRPALHRSARGHRRAARARRAARRGCGARALAALRGLSRRDRRVVPRAQGVAARIALLPSARAREECAGGAGDRRPVPRVRVREAGAARARAGARRGRRRDARERRLRGGNDRSVRARGARPAAGIEVTDEVRVVLVTGPDAETGARSARALVEERPIACGNPVPGVRSIYRWEGRVADEAEVLLLLKTRASRCAAVAARVNALHPYALPEVVALPVVDGSEAYLDWVLAESGN